MLETRLTFVEVLQGDMGAGVLLVVQRRMAVREGAAAHVLAGNADRVAFEQQGGVGHGFGIAPVDRQRTGRHLLPVFEDLRHLALQHKAFRNLNSLSASSCRVFSSKRVSYWRSRHDPDKDASRRTALHWAA